MEGKSDVTIVIDGGSFPLNEKYVSAVSITFGMGMIPQAEIKFDPTYLGDDVISNANKYIDRSSLTTLTIKANIDKPAEGGTSKHYKELKFEGYFDGLSVTRSRAGFDYVAVYKSKFIRLQEINPLFIGLNANSNNPFTSYETNLSGMTGGYLGWQSFKTTAGSVNANLTILKWIKEVIKLLVTTQQQVTAAVGTSSIVAAKLVDILSDEIYLKNLKETLPLIDKIDISFLNDEKYTATNFGTELLNRLMSTGNPNLMDMLLQCLDEVGCTIVLSNKSIFVVPKSKFIRFKNSKENPNYQELSNAINDFYPANHSSLMFNDVGFVNIKYAYVLPSTENDLAKGTSGLLFTTYNNLLTGRYVGDDSGDTDKTSGLYIANVSSFIFDSLQMHRTINTKIQKDIPKTEIPHVGQSENYFNSIKEGQQPFQEIFKGVTSIVDARQQFLDDYAKLVYLEQKYNDRSGSLSIMFNPHVVPGTTASVITRGPNEIFHFYVESVTHSISLNAPNLGEASSAISFSCMRRGKTSSDVPGVDEEPLYQYSSQKMKDLQEKFVSDLKS